MVSMPNFLKRKSPEDKFQDSFSILRTLNDPKNELSQKFNREIFAKVLEESESLSDPITPAEEEALVKDLLTQIILDHLSQAFAGLTFEELSKDQDSLDAFKLALKNSEPTYDPTTTEPIDFFKDTYLEKNDSTTGNPLWQNPNFSEGNSVLESKAIENDELYEQEPLEVGEVKVLLTEIINYIKNLPEDDKPEVEIAGSIRKVDTLLDLKTYLGVDTSKPEKSFESKESILNLSDVRLVNKALSQVKRSGTPSVKLLCSKYFHLLSESLKLDFAENLKNEILEPANANLLLAFNNILDLHPAGIGGLNKYELAQFFSSKRDLRLLSRIRDDDDFNSQFVALQGFIKDTYAANKSEYISYLHEQFVENPDVKVMGVTYITNKTQGKVADILTVREEASELGIDNTRLKELQEKAKKYPERLRNNFKNSKLSITRNREEMKELRQARLDVAKLRAYNAALDLELTNEELSNGVGTDKIKETVFQKAIKEDLDSLFLDYQAPPKANRLRKFFNKKTSWFGNRMAAGSAVTAFAVPAAIKFGLKTSATALAGPAAALGLGALFMKPLARRGLNYRTNSQSDIQGRIGLNFMEAARDMTGSVNDSLFSDNEDIENEFIKSQQEELKTFQTSLSAKVDRELDSDNQIKNQKDLLKNSIKNNDNPVQINQLAAKLKKLISKKVTEIYTQEYKMILKQTEDKRAKYVGRLVAESALGVTAMFATLGVVEGLGYLAGIEDTASATEKPSTPEPTGNSTDTTPKDNTPKGNDPFSKAEDTKPTKTPEATKNVSKSMQAANSQVSNATEQAASTALEAAKAKDFTFTVPTDADLVGTTHKDPGLVRLFRAWTDNKLSVSEAYEAAKMLKLDNVDLIRDGQELVIPKEAVEFISQKTDINPTKLAERDMLSQYIKYNKA